MHLTRRQAIAIAVACGLLAAFLSYLYLRRPSRAPQPTEAPRQVSVLVAAVDIETGTRLTADMVSVKSLPEKEAPRGAISPDEGIGGLVAVAPVKAGDVLTKDRVRRPSAKLGLAFLVPPGMRAVTVSVDEVSAVGWLLKPGDRVDVLGTFELGDNVTLTRTVLQDVELLAIGTEVAPAEEEAPAEGEEKRATAPKRETTATLAVTPEEGQRLVLADSAGKLRLALRRAGDTSRVSIAPVTLAHLTGYRPKKEQEVPAEQVVTPPPPWYQPPKPAEGAQRPAKTERPKNAVEVVRGGEREVIVP